MGWRRTAQGRVLRSLGALVVVAGLVAAVPAGAAATVGGGCTVTGTSTSGGAVDLTSTAVWHVLSTDQVSASGSAPFQQFHGSASAYALGFALPLGSGDSTGGDTSFQSDTYDVSTLAFIGRVFVVAGSSTSAFHGCDGRVEIVIDDVNPFLTVLGGGAVVAMALGLLLLIFGLRRSDRTWRRLVGLIGLAFLSGGAALLLQQTSTPGQPAFDVAGWVASVASPAQVSLDPVIVIESLGLSLLFVLVMPFPSELFNRTLEENRAAVEAALGRVPVIGRLLARPTVGDDAPAGGTTHETGWRNPIAVAAVVVVAALLNGFLDPRFGPTPSSYVHFAGIVAAMVGVRWIGTLPRRAMERSMAERGGHWHAVPWTLVIAALCVLISRVAGFEPGYLYGLILGYVFARELPRDEEGRLAAAGAWWMAGLALVSWFALGAVRTPGVEPTLPAAVLASVLAALVVAGTEGLVFGLVPLRFMHGEAIFRWSRTRWAILYGFGLFGFFWIILDPVNGFVAERAGASFISALALFAAFGLASVLFWAYFRGRPRPASAAQPPSALPM